MALSLIERLIVILRSIIACSGISIMLISASVMLIYVHEIIETGTLAALQRTEMAPMTAVCFFFTGLACVAGAILWTMRARGNDHDD
jgi:hypothetical protein